MADPQPSTNPAVSGPSPHYNQALNIAKKRLGISDKTGCPKKASVLSVAEMCAAILQRRAPTGKNKTALWEIIRAFNIAFPDQVTLANHLDAASFARKRAAKKAQRTPRGPIPFVATPAFLRSFQWRRLRMEVLTERGAKCECCGATREDGALICVDHIKPRKVFPELALDKANLQVLCGVCNHGKGNWDETDWRKAQLAPRLAPKPGPR